MKAKAKKILLVLLTLFVSVFAGAALYVHLSLQDSLPITEGTITLDGPRRPIEITFDSLGIPQIWAETFHDAYFGLGYQHAADRMFQLDLARRVSQGRLSEILGEATLGIDIRQRTVGHNRLARAALDNLSDSTRALLEAYSSGINAYLESGSAPTFEFMLLQTEFEKWTVYDCLTLFSFQTWFSDAIQNRDDFFIKVAEQLGEQKARTLLLPYPDWAPYTVPRKHSLGAAESIAPTIGAASSSDRTLSRQIGEGAGKTARTLNIASENISETFRRAVSEKLLANDGWGFALSVASNGWALAPKKSSNGKALLAGDPHLDVTRLPQFWYAVGMHSAEDSFDAFGVTAPGLPFIAMGHNRTAAWTFTAAGIDLTDYFKERINADDSLQYQSPQGWRDFEVVPETIYIAGLDSALIEQVRLTGNGPITLTSDSANLAYSLRWAGAEMDLAGALENSLALMRVTDFSSFRKIVTGLGALDANWIYADSAGNIGFQLGSPIPIRPDNSENLALDGWKENQSWRGYHKLDETPWALNPEQGWLANCNNKQDQPNLAYDLSGAYFADRILRVAEYLSAVATFSLDDMRALQLERRDNYFLRWAAELPPMLSGIGENEWAGALENWDGSAGTDSRETALIAEFLLQLKLLTFSDELGDQTGRLKRLWVDQIYHSSDTFWFDDITTENVVETRGETAGKALRKAVDAIGGKTWGDIHSLRMAHAMSIVPLLSGYLGLERGPWRQGGTGGTVNASYYRDIKSADYRTLAAPSWRMLIDMAEPGKALVCLPAGNSGNPLSEHFFDFNPLWRDGRYWEVSLDSSTTYTKAASVLKLLPR
ncbi:MAG: penicillin acylase family protein [candidate division Zixibacteria bacterium]|nr:penicillin acylase family protein [candidate division Zixibacteria bacterium]